MVFTRPIFSGWHGSSAKRARAAGGSLQLAAPTPSVRRLITLTRLTDVFPIPSAQHM
jgi:anti-anti-sigma regulatory factor